jgi:hypothetical protein
MKSKFNALVIACVMMSFAAVAASPVAFSVTSSTANVFNISYKTAEVSNVRISIYNSNTELVFTEVLNNVASFVRPYNFSELTEGEYTIVVSNKNGTQTEKVNFTSNKINSIISVSEVANAENKYALNVTNNGTEDVYVRIFDNNSNLLHEQSVQVTGSFGLIYNLSKVKSTTGTSITFEVSTESGKFEKITF